MRTVYEFEISNNVATSHLMFVEEIKMNRTASTV